MNLKNDFFNTISKPNTIEFFLLKRNRFPMTIRLTQSISESETSSVRLSCLTIKICCMQF